MAGKTNQWTITISRQMGSLGMEVAHSLQNLLGYRVIWREIINQAARRAGAPDAALAAIDELGLLGICPSLDACEAYRKAVEQVMRELATEGQAVIVGRAGQAILAGEPSVMHVRIVAPVENRIERVAARQRISIKAAAAQIEVSDRFRRNYLKRFYNIQWDMPELYNLVINTGLVGSAEAADIISHALHRQQQAAETVSAN